MAAVSQLYDRSRHLYDATRPDYGNGQIRVLQLQPEQVLDVIRCTFHVSELLEASDYVALSYSWELNKGEAELPEITRITLETEAGLREDDLCIHLNLFNFLRTIRSDKTALTLWIDALCINQRDKSPEKATAVAMMDKIYRSAKSTIIWLGDSSPSSSIAMEAVRDFQDQNFDDEDICPFDFKWLAVRGLLRRRWFQRLWVLQEVLLSREPVTVQCGTDTAPLSKFIELRLAQNRYNAKHT
jgi:hypothetical protein